MFAASKIRRATELKVPFLQCDTFFHTISLTELQSKKVNRLPDFVYNFDQYQRIQRADEYDFRSSLNLNTAHRFGLVETSTKESVFLNWEKYFLMNHRIISLTQFLSCDLL